MQVLESYLVELHGLVDSNSVYADPKAFMQDMRAYVLNEVNDDDLGTSSFFYFFLQNLIIVKSPGLCSSILFASEHNLLHWLDRAVLNQHKSFIDSREIAFAFLDEYIKILGRRVQDYALDIKVFILISILIFYYGVYKKEKENLIDII